MKLRIGKAIAHFREQRNMSQTDLANATGIGQPTISLYESDARMPSNKNLIKITDALNVTIEELEIIASEKQRIMQSIGRVHRPDHFDKAEIFITENVSVQIRAMARDHSSRAYARFNVVTGIVENAVRDFIEQHIDEINELVQEEIQYNVEKVEEFLTEFNKNRY